MTAMAKKNSRASIAKRIRNLSDRFRVDRPGRFRLSDVDPGDTAGIEGAEAAKEALVRGVERIDDLQARLFAQDRWSVLVVFQAMDAAGKDSTIAHVMTGVNPAGVEVYSFKAPSTTELDHDYLWRHVKCLPERGRIGIFNRSWYEEVLVVRVHPQILAGQKVPEGLLGERVWEERFEDINAFERYLARNGVLVLKFFLHVSKEEQRKRFLSRIDEPAKNWKFSLGDVEERAHWDDYMHAYESMIQATSTPSARWYVVPADNKWFTRLAVAEALGDAMSRLDLSYPEFDEAKRSELAEARRRLEREGRGR